MKKGSDGPTPHKKALPLRDAYQSKLPIAVFVLIASRR
ncbi:MAG TPA: hypothetical protein DEB17_00800 [Chlorobaculum sp.]|uniref:Uncharacterized protein n=1 Tax=Chlorobaculum tepidum (strain ATCC 49652 / DSM 12025 / NBRC 103806 / TLS) TaxID=194439 RepID=Q8KBU6_CHLTE|nr:hypothetical protein CT1686 [Chlorobaculum tepidum TLS]HBU22539.1 hypothetical protein [Chlorobaculum sp.]